MRKPPEREQGPAPVKRDPNGGADLAELERDLIQARREEIEAERERTRGALEIARLSNEEGRREQEIAMAEIGKEEHQLDIDERHNRRMFWLFVGFLAAIGGLVAALWSLAFFGSEIQRDLAILIMQGIRRLGTQVIGSGSAMLVFLYAIRRLFRRR